MGVDVITVLSTRLRKAELVFGIFDNTYARNIRASK